MGLPTKLQSLGKGGSESKPGSCHHIRRLNRWALATPSHLDFTASAKQLCICCCHSSQFCSGVGFLKHDNRILILFSVPENNKRNAYHYQTPTTLQHSASQTFRLLLATYLKGINDLLSGGGSEKQSHLLKVPQRISVVESKFKLICLLPSCPLLLCPHPAFPSCPFSSVCCVGSLCSQVGGRWQGIIGC